MGVDAGEQAGRGDDPALDEPVEEPAGEPAPVRRHSALRRVLISLGILGLVLAVLVGGGLWFLTNRYAGNIDRVSDVFNNLDERTRPAPATPAVTASDEPVTFLLVGSDTRGQTLAGHGRSKINASYSWGGPSLLIQTVEQLTSVRIDHYVAIDFDGIIQVTDDLRSDSLSQNAAEFSGEVLPDVPR
jgi:hypothetical protein